MKGYVLIITSSFDEHVDLLSPKFEARGASVFRLNTDQLDRYEIGLMPTDPFLHLKDRVSGKKITAGEIESVWYRRPSPDRSFDQKLDDESLKLFRSEAKEWIKSISFSLGHAFWVTSPTVLYKARIKSNQLLNALDAGLNVPKTIVTKDRALVENFHEQCPDGMIAKSLRAPYVESDDAYYALRTQQVEAKDLDDPSLYICPTVFQERIRARYELRVVVIGKHLFFFKVVPKRETGVDIRSAGPGNIEYSLYSPPVELEEKVRTLITSFNLPFSSMDLLIDQDGNEYFVDLNPNGQWLWLEYVTGVDLSGLFVEMMVRGTL